MDNDAQPIEFRFGKRGESASFNCKTKNIRVNLRYVDSVEHLYSLIEHEVVHKILDEDDFDITAEHKLIDRMSWAEYIL
jgi:hypothetical protein|tara:strand:+ start:6687 stop:6923 length:237 start_codon:yes stop_codon:yes gene_type:complete